MKIFKRPVSEERVAFEAWLRHTHPQAVLVRTGKGYTNEITRVAWRAWRERSQR